MTEIQKLVHLLNQPLESARLTIRPQLGSDAEAAFTHLQDDALRQWISLHKPASVDALRQSWQRNETRLSPDGREAWLQWFVTSKVDGSPIGSIDACVDQDKVAVNFGYYFFVHAWGRGYATEAVAVVAKHLLSNGAERLLATVTVGNAASVRVLERNGSLYTRTIADNDTVNGRLVDDDEYVLTRERLDQC
jgi:ribosomal-protein-alanine N-acetyltransferase